MEDEQEDYRQRSLGSAKTSVYGSVMGLDSISCSDKVPLVLPRKTERNFGFDISFVKRFYRLHKLLFLQVISASTAIFVLLLALVVLKEYVVYQVGLIPSGYYLTLGDKDLPAFWKQTWKSLGLILAVSFISSTVEFVQKILSVNFRQLLCNSAHRLYFGNNRFYKLNVLDKSIDNPDQRMTQDIDKFCTTYCEVLPKLLVSPFTIGYYCYQGYQRSGWQGPVACFGFFLVCTAINKFLMTPVVNYVVRQEKCEGDFRFMHMLVRVYSESIAFQQASLLEQEKLDKSLTKLVNTQRSLYFRQYFLYFSTNLFDYVGSIFSYLMLAIPIFSGEHDDLDAMDLSVLISQNAFVLIYLIFSFTSVVDLSTKFTDVAGATHRVSQLLERMKCLEDSSKNYRRSNNLDNGSLTLWSGLRRKVENKVNSIIGYADHFVEHNEDNQQDDTSSGVKVDESTNTLIWSLENVTFSRPMSMSPLISNLSINFVVGESVLITGPSSAGKTSILRLLRGLWPNSHGRLEQFYPPGPTGVYFCTQKAYLSWGTIREQISFPLYPDKSKRSDQLIEYYIEKLNLRQLVRRVGGLDVECTWTMLDSLSPGEVQRLCLLRIFYHQPVAAILDEVTSALPLDMEEFLYSELKRLGITLISVGHRESIRKYHDKQLLIDSNGSWEIIPIV